MAAPASAAQVRAWLVIRIALIVVVVAGLTVDAYVHLDLASNYRLIKTSTLSQADLFRAEGAVAIIAALWLVVRPRRYTAAIAALVATVGLPILVRGRQGARPRVVESDPSISRATGRGRGKQSASSTSRAIMVGWPGW